MIYLDTSVVLAELLAEDTAPPPHLWQQPLISSRLLEYEVWTRLHSRSCAKSHGSTARELLGRIAFVQLAQPVLTRALDPFPIPVRTLDALHLASVEFLRSQRQEVWFASYDERLRRAAHKLGVPLYSM